MNHLEFVGNALFIPYFLIGVGMLVNVNLLFGGVETLHVAAVMIVMALSSKWIASLVTQKLLGMRPLERNMIFGLSTAQAGATLAAVLVGHSIFLPNGQRLLNDDVLNGTVILSAMPKEEVADDEKIMISMKYPETASLLMEVANLMRNRTLNRGVVALNVVYDDEKRLYYQERGRQLLDHVTKEANAIGLMVQSQVRIATNITNGIKHAFKEFNASEIIMGMHMRKDTSKTFWGKFIQGIFWGLNRQVIIVESFRPLNTLRCIQVAVPSRAEFEPGFYRWLERLSRMAENLECRVRFHCRIETQALIQEYIKKRHPEVRAEYQLMAHWNELPRLAREVADDHMFVVITARKGTISYKSALERLPDELTQYYQGKNLMIIFPDQYGAPMMTMAEPQHTEDKSAYAVIGGWFMKSAMGKYIQKHVK